MGEKTQRSLHFAIIDEVDSVLIDEARTPLIISGGSDVEPDEYVMAYHLPSLKVPPKLLLNL